MREVTISIPIAAQDYLANYQGSISEVLARSSSARNIRFPARFYSHSLVMAAFMGVLLAALMTIINFSVLVKSPDST